LAVVAGLSAGAPGRALAADTFAWTPADAPAVTLGRHVMSRFDLANLVEITVEVDNAFSATNREALLGAEQRLAAVPGVRRVFGPARLLDLTIDAAGKPSARAVLARGTSESDGEAARQRVVRRADALGWFVTANGRRVRFLIDADDFARVRRDLAAALVTSGLGLVQTAAGDGLSVRRLAPDPRAHGAPWLPAAVSAAWVLFVLAAGFKARPLTGKLSTGGATAIVVAAALGAAAPFALVSVGGVRLAGAMAAAAAAAAALLGLLLERRRGLRPGGWNRIAHPPRLALALALAPLVAFAVLAPRLRVGTHLWSDAPLLFVSVRGEIDQPVVVQEITRLTEFVRAQPGVESAWSVADLFMGVETEGEEASRIPPDAEQVRQVLVQARTDPAVALELAADHREALVVVRFDEGEGLTDRLDLVDRLGMYAAAELRAWLLPVDLRAPSLPAVTRGVAKGLLASDTRARILGICERSNRPLTPAEALAVERVARQAAAIPSADQGRLRTELADDARDFLSRYPVPLRPGEQARLIDALVALPDDATVADVSRACAATFGDRLSPRVLEDTAAILARRLAAVRWRHTARINFHDVLFGAELPTEGVLADEVRSAILQGMGPVAGIPVAPSSPGAHHIEATAVGGAANDRALSDAWWDGLRRGSAAVVVAWGVLLVLAGGAVALGWLPLALAPAAAAALPSALLREPLGLWSLAFLAGALAAGGFIAAAWAARRRA
jgi:hypothetical protein